MNHLRIQEIYGKIEEGFPKIISDLKKEKDGVYNWRWTNKFSVTFYCNGNEQITFNFENLLNELLECLVLREK